MGLLSKLFGAPPKTRRRRSWSIRSVLAKPRGEPPKRLLEELAIAYPPPTKAKPGHVLLRKGRRYRWTLQFTNVRGGKLTEEQIETILAGERRGAKAIHVVRRNPLVLAYVVGQPLTANIPIGKQTKPQWIDGVRQKTLSIVEVER